LFINFWATWCEPCREEIPALIRLQRASSSKNLQIVGIALDSPERVAEFAKSYSINYPLLIGGMGAMEMMRAHGNGIGALPFTLVVAPEGSATRAHLGPMSVSEMESLIAATQSGDRS
jgi:thiol-disulfide isomerase/thioredoxin